MCISRLFDAQFYPVYKGHSAADDLHRPHSQPEAQGPAQFSDEGGEGELGNVGLGHRHLGVDVQSKRGGTFHNSIVCREGSYRYLGELRLRGSTVKVYCIRLRLGDKILPLMKDKALGN